MLLSLLFSGYDLRTILAQLLLTIPVVVLALSLHETAHGFVAWKCGDPTAHNMGRLTLNPIKHLDPLGFLLMLLFGFGWAKPVPINTRNFRNPKWGMVLSAAAGPLANMVLGVISAFLFGASLVFSQYATLSEAPAFLITCLGWASTLFQMSALYNFLFMAFNLIPIPPFDGSRIALAFLPAKIYFGLMKYERYIMLGLLLVIFVLSRFGFSPFESIAYGLTNLVATPALILFASILL